MQSILKRLFPNYLNTLYYYPYICCIYMMKYHIMVCYGDSMLVA